MSFLSTIALMSFAALNAVDASPLKSCSKSLGSGPLSHAVYVMGNDAQNIIVAMSVGPNSTLSGGSLYSTGGAGGNLISPTTGEPNVPDALAVQDSVVVAWPYLFNVNPGSATVSMFQIDVEDPTKLTLLGQPMSSNGDFPTALAVSKELRMVCVANTGSLAGVACAKYGPHGLDEFDALRMLDVGQNTTTPTGPLSGIGDILFDESGQTLFVMVKGDGMTEKGYVAVYSIVGGNISSTASEISPNGTAVLFGAQAVPHTSKIFASDASLGAVILDASNLSTPIAITTIPEQKASCWAQITPQGSGYITDVGVNRLVEVDLTTGAIKGYYTVANNNAGMTDFRISRSGEVMWALSANNGTLPAVVTTIALPYGELTDASTLQTFKIPAVGPNTIGLAIV